MQKTPWNNSAYQKIKDVKYLNEKFNIVFDNNDNIELDRKLVAPFDQSEIDWENYYFNSYEIIIPAKPQDIEIPWDKLRVLTDKDFAKYLSKKAEEQAMLIGKKIKRLREKLGIKSFELAERANITPQTISRIEQGHTDVSFATLRKILIAMGYTLRDLADQEKELELEKSDKNLNFLLKKLSRIGLDTNLLTTKIIPKKIQTVLQKYKVNQQPEMLLDEAATYISTVYNWSLKDIWSNNELLLENEPVASAYLKTPQNANYNHIKAYSYYAYYLAEVVLKAYSLEPKYDYPESAEDFKRNLLKHYGKFDFESLLNYVWDLGICVLPLNDSGVFHGASWNIKGKHIVILKQNTLSHAKWMFDLLHELYHVFVHLQKNNTSIIETEELTPISNTEYSEELEANAFANQIIFGNRAEALAQKSMEEANWKLENLKKSVSIVSKKEKIREDFLSNYLAFRLSYQGQNWWSTASKMQITTPDPFELSVNKLRKNISMQKLNPMDFNLLNTAISN